VLAPPAGWELEQESSKASHLSIYGPPSEAVDKTEAFMIARAVKPANGQKQQQFIEAELDNVLSRQLDLHALATTPLNRNQSQEWPVYRIATERENDPVESMVFGQDGDFFVVFILSTRNQKVHDLLWQKFNDWVIRYENAETPSEKRLDRSAVSPGPINAS
jgi:hypothetical protein